MPPPRTPLNKPYRGHHPRPGAAQKALRPAHVAPAPAEDPSERTLILTFRTQHDRDEAKQWLDSLWDDKRTECICG